MAMRWLWGDLLARSASAIAQLRVGGRERRAAKAGSMAFRAPWRYSLGVAAAKQVGGGMTQAICYCQRECGRANVGLAFRLTECKECHVVVPDWLPTVIHLVGEVCSLPNAAGPGPLLYSRLEVQ